MKIKLLILSFLLFGFVPMTMADDTDLVQKLVKDKIGQVITYLKDKKIEKSIRNQKIISTVEPIFDFGIMAKVSMGKENWMAMSKEQREEFIKLFVQRLKESYLEKLDLYTDEDVAVDNATMHKSRIYVKTFLVSKTDKKEMIYKFYKAKTDWKIYDIEILGVSIVQTYRSQFSGLVQNGGIEGLLNKLRKSGSLKAPIETQS